MNWNMLKKAIIGLIVSCVLVTSMPSFSLRSQAVEYGAVYLSYEAFLALESYLATRGMSRIFSRDSNVIISRNNYSPAWLESILHTIELSNIATRMALQHALTRATQTGIFSIDAETASAIDDAISSGIVDSQYVIGQSNSVFGSYPASVNVPFQFMYVDALSNNSAIYDTTTSLQTPYECLPVLGTTYTNGILTNFRIYFVPYESMDYATINPIYQSFTYSSDGTFPWEGFGFDNGKGLVNLGATYALYVQFKNIVSVRNPNRELIITHYNLPLILSIAGYDNNALSSIFDYYSQHRYYENSSDLVTEQIYDTSNEDVLSSESTIDSTTADVSGPLTIYLPDVDKLESILNQFSTRAISWATAIKRLGLSHVDSDASAQTKENALANVAYPDSTYKWFSQTTWGETKVQGISEAASEAHTNEVAISESVGTLLARETGRELTDQEREKAYNSMLLGSLLMWLGIWGPPNFSGEDPNGGGIGPEDPDDPYGTSGYIGDTIAGISVVSGLIESAFNSAGGSNGFGIVFTLGASFVIFSVLIGAANYFGSRGDDVQTSNSSSNPNNRSAKSKQKSKPHKANKAS